MSTKNPTNEISILSLDSYDNLDKTLKKTIKDLSDVLPGNSLNKFNPIVVEAVEIENFKAIKYTDEVSIKSFKEAISKIRSFRAKTKKTKSVLKKPYLETGRKIDSIEKNFIELANETESILQIEFSEYLKQEEEKKNAKLLEERKAKEEAERIQKEQEAEILKKSKIIELRTKYDNLIPEHSKKIEHILQNYSIESLEKSLISLKEKMTIIDINDIIHMDDSMIKSIDANFMLIKENWIIRIENKIKELKLELLIKEPLAPEVIQEINKVDLPPPPSSNNTLVPFKKIFKSELYDFMKKVNSFNCTNEENGFKKSVLTRLNDIYETIN